MSPTHKCPKIRLHDRYDAHLEQAAGLFHLQIQALMMLIQAHIGKTADICSLERCKFGNGKDGRKMWAS
jgi:hypothetical protein